MGGHPWFYIVDYDDDAARALCRLRDREFKAGRYNPVMPFPPFPVEAGSPSPGPKHGSIGEALAASAENGTRSILDIEMVGEDLDYGVAAPLDPELVFELYGTEQPTRELVEKDSRFLDVIPDRGQCVYFPLYDEAKQPRHLLFVGYSFD